MTNEEGLRLLISDMAKLDCGDHSCIFAKDKSGMRTNGGCMCLDSYHKSVRIALQNIFYNYKINGGVK